MKKIVALLLATLMLFSLAACQNEQDDVSNDGGSENIGGENVGGENETSVTPAEIQAAIANALGDGYIATVDVTENRIPKSALAEIDLNKLESYVAKETIMPDITRDTVVVVKCKDASYADEVVDHFNAFFAILIGYVRDYPVGVTKVENTRIFKVGDTVMFILGGANADGNATEEETAQLALAEYEKIDEAIKTLFGSLPENLAVMPD